MRVGRTLPPAAPLCGTDLWHGLAGLVAPARTLERFEAEIRTHFAVNDVFLVSSGAAALALTLIALRSRSTRTEVVIPAYTCPSVPAAVLQVGLRPRLCDVDPDTFDFDRAQLEQVLNGNTLCVIAHHLFGIGSDIDATRRLCVPRGIVVVEDAAQAMGVDDNGSLLGTVGDVGIFSLGRGKAITCGSGGIIVTRSKPIAAAIDEHYRCLPSPSPVETLKDIAKLFVLAAFIHPRLYWIPAALPWLKLGETIYPARTRIARLPAMKAGLLRNWRRRLADSSLARSAVAAYFTRRLRLRPPAGRVHPYLRLPIHVETPAQKKRLFASSQGHGLGFSVAYPQALADMTELRGLFSGEQYPAARRLAGTLLTLPTHQWLSKADKRAIVACLRSGLTKRRRGAAGTLSAGNRAPREVERARPYSQAVFDHASGL
jgi:dTDP-4-amino-4,6-dideoxygalactose transaminase